MRAGLKRSMVMPGAERVRKYMIRSIFSLEQLPFLEPEGKAGY
jgi:hypothetical protein